MTDRNSTGNSSAHQKYATCLDEIGRTLEAVRGIQCLVAHLETIQTASEIEETRSVMLVYYDQLIEEIVSAHRRGMDVCM